MPRRCWHSWSRELLWVLGGREPAKALPCGVRSTCLNVLKKIAFLSWIPCHAVFLLRWEIGMFDPRAGLPEGLGLLHTESSISWHRGFPKEQLWHLQSQGWSLTDESQRSEKASVSDCLLYINNRKDTLTPLLPNVILEMFANKLSSFL